MLKRKAPAKGIFALPYAVICVIFVVFPLILLLIYAFRGENGGFTFGNFAEVFTNSSNYMALLKTVGTALLATGICLLIAYPLAYILAAAPFNKIAILALLFVVPMWMNFILRIFALQSLLSMLGIEKSYGAAVIGLVYDFLPFMLLPIYTALVNLDTSYAEAAGDLGANAVGTFLRTTLPMSVPGIISGVMMVFMPCFSAYAITDMMGDSNTAVIGGKIDYLISQNQWGVGSALAFVLLVLVIAVMVVGNLVASSRNAKANASALTRGGSAV
ncbi:MAG: ABC transporter permease [Clostridia bacterium]|nr:ABC transporter permease [Clostridia bacterium]